jgi:hypothetical protein
MAKARLHWGNGRSPLQFETSGYVAAVSIATLT